MRKIINCISILFLSLFLVINFPVEITADIGDKFTVGDFVYEQEVASNYVVTLIGLRDGVDTLNNPTIPNIVTVGGYNRKVITIAEGAFKNKTGLTGTLTIGNELKTIKASAFEGCTGLTSIVGINTSANL